MTSVEVRSPRLRRVALRCGALRRFRHNVPQYAAVYRNIPQHAAYINRRSQHARQRAAPRGTACRRAVAPQRTSRAMRRRNATQRTVSGVNEPSV